MSIEYPLLDPVYRWHTGFAEKMLDRLLKSIHQYLVASVEMKVYIVNLDACIQ